ncbi:Rne/Rng family ribonuclease [Phormidium sp. CLA17]|uniref:Rne/Rng family ribonuclease n=1 Tax=Leptolyngbya sp. Cla-17 TaxID=2803751 RepID=UPI0014930C06|nr:Rne/Rng family ribonuclease [Leptolyngbya sp. Cla-17]MBM0741055.1 Rne/Rng family ribonuclease [Leptolyngbya sp. Cla-17]
MPKQIIIAEQHRIAAVFSEDQIQELIVATGTHQVSDVYLGVVENVLPGIDAAFINIGDSERNGFIHVTDLGPLKLQRAAGSITELLRPQQKVLVQVMKEPTGNKGPRLTGNISFPGRYLVLMPHGKGVNLSRRIRNENERNRLRALAILIKPAGMGLVVRTEAEGVPEEAIIEDLEALQEQWETICREATSTRAPALLNRDDDFIQRVLRDVYSGDVNRIVADSHTGLRRVKQHLMSWGGGKLPQGVLIDHHRDRISVLEYFRINAAIREALKPRVDLPSGGYIIIERTEALTVVDVNSGSFTRSATARETVLWTNCEAATEIARQLRLRNIAGIIIVDFIDMESRRDQLQVLEHFNKALRSDKARPQIAQLTELGLIELTRKRQGKNIYELFGRACPTCVGIGQIVHLPGELAHSDEEVAESPAVTPIREYRSDRGPTRGREVPSRELPDISLPAEFPWEEREDEETDDLQEMLSHPNYQEVGGNNRRRRRRRTGEESPTTSRERGRGTAWSESRVPTRLPNNGVEDRSSPDGDLKEEEVFESKPKEREVPRGRRDSPESSALRNRVRRDNGLEPGEIAEEKEAIVSSEVEEKRGRSRRESKPVEPPEMVMVEMTPEEQEVYAWMGVSPLVLSQQDVKNPKSAVISVVLPGQAPPVQLTVDALEASTALVNAVEPVIELEESDYSQPVQEKEKPAIAASIKIAPKLAEVTLEPTEPKPEPALEPEPEPEADNGIVRRRRRRSSASTTD